MFGIIGGMLRTLEHFVRPRPVTRKYPYEKRVLPERSRGLIALLLEPETSIFKCESCLMCEKACPLRDPAGLRLSTVDGRRARRDRVRQHDDGRIHGRLAPLELPRRARG